MCPITAEPGERQAEVLVCWPPTTGHMGCGNPLTTEEREPGVFFCAFCMGWRAGLRVTATYELPEVAK
ncbi:MAG TPA: hypothetical protein VLF21_03675 [Candidatus Saccharimonadales bacterium]|nr:hypothetical protein [Candidatus Saccharimonadales bacterium]